MEQYAYFLFLLLSIGSMSLIDYRYKLAWWFDGKKTLKVLSIALAIFLAWDLVGIKMGIFFSGYSPYMMNIYVLPELPVEEFLFLYFLNYFVLIMLRLVGKNV